MTASWRRNGIGAAARRAGAPARLTLPHPHTGCTPGAHRVHTGCAPYAARVLDSPGKPDVTGAGAPARGVRPAPAPAGAARRAGARLASFLLLLLAAVCAFSPRAEAQPAAMDSTPMVTTFVDNTAESRLGASDIFTDGESAQSFTTGMNAGGYVLSSIEIVSTAQNKAFSVEVHTTDADGGPDTLFATLTAPSDFSVADVEFTATANTVLAANTTYAVFLPEPSGLDAFLSATLSNTDGGSDGWGIGDAYHFYNTGTSAWQLAGSGRSLRMAVKGTAVASSGSNPATGLPAVTGTARVGSTVTASTALIRDADGLTGPAYEYQWLRVDGGSDTEISGATGRTYELTADDAGKRVRVRVSFTDDALNEETLTSSAFPRTGTIAMPVPAMTDPSDLLSATLTVKDVASQYLGCTGGTSASQVFLQEHRRY